MNFYVFYYSIMIEINNNLFEILNKYIKKTKRISHSISCANFMRKYAADFSIDPEKAYIAGLLHDLGKELPHEKILEFALSYSQRNYEKLEYLSFKKRHIFLLHGAASAELMIRELGINDPDILIAASHHTTGGFNIPKLAKYTFLADFCEPKRKYKHSKIVYKALIKENDFNKAYHLTYKYLIESLLVRNWEICPESIEGYNEALLLINAGNR